MANISVAAEWQLLHNRYYRKPHIYTMQWRNIDLSRNKIACAPFGGPIAAIRDDSKLVQLFSEPALRQLRLFSSSGLLLSEAPWRHPSGRLFSMSWSEDLTLICLLHDSTILLYNLQAHLLHPQISLSPSQSVLDCFFWGRGVVFLTDSNHVFSVSDLSNPTFCKLPFPELYPPPFCLTVIEPQHTMSGNVEVLLAVDDYVLLLEEEEEGSCTRIGEGVGPIQKMAVSQNGKLLACFTHEGKLLVMKTDFSMAIFEHYCDSSLPPTQMVWCGLDSVLLSWDDLLLMVGPFGDPITYSYEEPIILVPEVDGVRVLSSTCMEFLQRVPDSTVSIFKIGSTLPSALLYDAFEHFDRRSSKADENLRLIRTALPEAVEACIDAAGHEFDIHRQRVLLMAASYGQAFCHPLQRDRFQEMCRNLRVLNAVRSREVGIPLTLQQYRVLSPSILVSRLVNSHHHLLALRISEYLSMNKEEVLQHWACCKISSSTTVPDGALLDLLLEKLKLCRGVSYASVASHADGLGRRKLAGMLVEHEPKASKQVPLLLSIGEVERGLSRAVDSGDTDLVYLVLLHSYRKCSTLDFFSMIRPKQIACDLFKAYGMQHDREVVKDYHLWSGEVEEVAYMVWRESWEMGKGLTRVREMEKVQKLFEERREYMFEERAAEEHKRLRKIQEEMERRTKQEVYVDSSVSDTIRMCIVMGNEKGAAKVRGEMKVTEKRWYWLKVMAMAGVGDWEGLERFSKEKRPPIGYRPFVEVCLEAGEKGEAVKYIGKVGDVRERAELYAAAGMGKEAAETAAQAKDGDQLLGRFGFSLSLSNSGAGGGGSSSLFDTLKDVLSFQTASSSS